MLWVDIHPQRRDSSAQRAIHAQRRGPRPCTSLQPVPPVPRLCCCGSSPTVASTDRHLECAKILAKIEVRVHETASTSTSALCYAQGWYSRTTSTDAPRACSVQAVQCTVCALRASRQWRMPVGPEGGQHWPGRRDGLNSRPPNPQRPSRVKACAHPSPSLDRTVKPGCSATARWSQRKHSRAHPDRGAERQLHQSSRRTQHAAAGSRGRGWNASETSFSANALARRHPLVYTITIDGTTHAA